MSVFNKRLDIITEALNQMPEQCVFCCYKPAADYQARAQALGAVNSIRTALDADERFNRRGPTLPPPLPIVHRVIPAPICRLCGDPMTQGGVRRHMAEVGQWPLCIQKKRRSPLTLLAALLTRKPQA